jgi:hypothetical protein
VVVALLLLLWSRKELNLGNCKCCTDDEEDIAASQKPLAIALFRSSQSKSIPSRPNQIPSQAFNPNAISLQLGNSFNEVLNMNSN